MKQAEQVELALRLHLVEHLIGREIVDTDDQARAQLAEGRRQALENLMRHDLHLGERRRFCLGPHAPCLARVPPKSMPVWPAAAVDLVATIGDRTRRNE